MIDSHCHIDFDAYHGRQAEVIREAAQAGVHTLVNIGANLESSQRSVALAEKHEAVYATVGIHPHDAATCDDAACEQLRALASKPKVVAIGEIGLDYYRDLSPRPVQKKAFAQQLQLAVDLKLPVVIHTREAFEATLEIVKEYAADIPGGVFHCFPGTARDAERAFSLGFVVGVGGVITYQNSSMARMVAEIPLDRIVLETDAPYLTPVPHRGKTNHPAHIAIIRDKLAELHGVSADEVEKTTDRTCQKLYRLVETFGD